MRVKSESCDERLITHNFSAKGKEEELVRKSETNVSSALFSLDVMR